MKADKSDWRQIIIKVQDFQIPRHLNLDTSKIRNPSDWCEALKRLSNMFALHSGFSRIQPRLRIFLKLSRTTWTQILISARVEGHSVDWGPLDVKWNEHCSTECVARSICGPIIMNQQRPPSPSSKIIQINWWSLLWNTVFTHYQLTLSCHHERFHDPYAHANAYTHKKSMGGNSDNFCIFLNVC